MDLMIKRLDVSNSNRRHRTPEWPVNPDKDVPLFSKRPALRTLKVMVDFDLTDFEDDMALDFESAPSLKRVLRVQLQSEFIQYYIYADKGPPNQVKPMVLPKSSFASNYKVYEGWVTVDKQVNSDHLQVTYSEGPGKLAVSGVSNAWPNLAFENATNSFENSFSADIRRADVLALGVAEESLEADIYITDRPFLHGDSKFAKKSGLTVCTLAEAVPLIGLYLRAQGQYNIPTGGDEFVKFSYDSGLFFWVGMRELLPEAWRWFHACVFYSHDSGDDKLMSLGGSTLNRVVRALMERDIIHQALNEPQNNNLSDSALGSLDSVLTLLMGAVDATARVANSAISTGITDKYAGWQNDGWIRKVADNRPSLSSLVDKNTDGWHALTILRLLRNSVHGAALQGVSLFQDGKKETLLGLPKDDEEKILLSMDALGGRDAWGFRPIIPGQSHVDPGLLVEKLFETTLKLLNDLMRETPVEDLPGIVIGDAERLPPVENASGIGMPTFSEWSRKSIRLQLGL